MPGKEVRYTHRDWRGLVQGADDAARELLGPALEHRHAGLIRVQAGETQLRQSARWAARVYELAGEGERILGDHDARLTRVSERQSAAGGVREVAGDKRYNQR